MLCKIYSQILIGLAFKAIIKTDSYKGLSKKG